MRLPRPFSWSGEHIGVELPGTRGLFTTRRGGVSTGAYATLNLGRLTQDEPGAVEHNRRLVEEMAGRPLSTIRQVHGSRIRHVASPAPPDIPPEEADGQATESRALAPIVLVADCLPVILAGDGVLAVLHAGWRGLSENIVAAGAQALRELGAGELHAAIGPGAGACCYEVGPEVHAHFSAYGPEARRGENLDLKAITRVQLVASGVSQVHDVGLCSICHPELLFSHRRDGGVTGRQAGLAWLS